MINTLLAGVLVSSVLNTAPTTIPKNYIATSFTQIISNDSYASYVVKEGDYLSKIAGEIYGSEDYWTNIANDNPEIQNASQLEAGTVLKIRDQKTNLPEVLDKDLIAGFDTQAEVKEPTYTYSISNGAQVTQPTVTVAPTPQITQQPVTTTNAPKSLTEEQITYLGNCEAGMDPAKNTGNGYYGAFQFSYGTWKSMNTGFERADLAPLEVQKEAVQRLIQRSSIFTQFPACSKRMRSIGMV